jgi:heme oxygenase (biliverdin-IX-beta and delta-forming)
MNKYRLALRERTRPQHENLDGSFSALQLVVREDYIRFLTAQAAVLPAIEQALTAAGAEKLVPEWTERLRAAALEQDLVALGAPIPAVEPTGEWIVDAPSIVGAAYVLEGSRLGGQMMRKIVMGSEDPVVANATAFLSHGEGRRFWPSFDAFLSEQTFSDEQTDTMVESAGRSFDAFRIGAANALRTLEAA